MLRLADTSHKLNSDLYYEKMMNEFNSIITLLNKLILVLEKRFRIPKSL